MTKAATVNFQPGQFVAWETKARGGHCLQVGIYQGRATLSLRSGVFHSVDSLGWMDLNAKKWHKRRGPKTMNPRPSVLREATQPEIQAVTKEQRP